MSIFSKIKSGLGKLVGNPLVSGILRITTGITVGASTAVVAPDQWVVQLAGWLLSAKEIVKGLSDVLNKVYGYVADIADDGKLNQSNAPKAE